MRVCCARGLRKSQSYLISPELALRASSERFRERVEAAEGLAAEAGQRWGELTPEEQLQFYVESRLKENP